MGGCVTIYIYIYTYIQHRPSTESKTAFGPEPNPRTQAKPKTCCLNPGSHLWSVPSFAILWRSCSLCTCAGFSCLLQAQSEGTFLASPPKGALSGRRPTPQLRALGVKRVLQKRNVYSGNAYQVYQPLLPSLGPSVRAVLSVLLCNLTARLHSMQMLNRL